MGENSKAKGKGPTKEALKTELKTLQDSYNILVGNFKKQLDDLKQLQQEHHKLIGDYKECNREREEALDSLGEDGEHHAQEIKVKDATIAQLTKKIEDLTEALRTAGKEVHVINDDLAKHVQEMTEIYVQRTWKFIENDEDIVLATEEVMEYLQTPPPVEKEEFVATYQKYVNNGLKNMRQNVQSEGKKRAKGMYGPLFLPGIFRHITQLYLTHSSFYLHRIVGSNQENSKW